MIQILISVLKFVNSCRQSDSLSKVMMSLALNGSDSVMCKNINFICEEYWIDKYNLCNSSFSSICKMTASGQAVRAFLLYRNSLVEDYNNISEIIREICEEWFGYIYLVFNVILFYVYIVSVLLWYFLLIAPAWHVYE